MEEEYSNLISQQTKEKIDRFVDFHQKKGTKVALVTSGGTTVPLEEKTVRFIDNFSAGTRGSASTEYFLANSYAVLFIHRKRSLKPFERLLSNSCPFDYLIPVENKPGEYRINPEKKPNFDKLFQSYQNAFKDNMLLEVDFITLFEYFSVLDYSCKAIDRLGQKCLVYLAAAVSDFYLPKSQMSVHKIQSSEHNSLHLDLKPVPKLLGLLRSQWCPQAFVVSFKLETDTNLLMGKSLQALDKYRHNCVVGNILEERKAKVVVIDSKQRVKDVESRDGLEIEHFLIDYLAQLHSEYLNA